MARSVTIKLLRAGKEKGCEIIKDWIKGIKQHIYWCATSTKAGFGINSNQIQDNMHFQFLTEDMT